MWRLNVASPAEALRAIDANTKGRLFRYLGTEGRTRHYKVALQRTDQLLEPTELIHPSGTSDIYFWPATKGRSSGSAKLIAGIALLAIVTIVTYGGGTAFYAAGTAATATSAGTAGGLTLIGTIAVGIGTSLVLGGISQLLSPNQKNNEGQLNSNNFQGTVAGAPQGGPVPVCYGKALVAPTVISIWFQAVDYNTTQGQYVGTLQVTDLPGGGTQYNQVAITPVVNDASGGG